MEGVWGAIGNRRLSRGAARRVPLNTKNANVLNAIIRAAIVASEDLASRDIHVFAQGILPERNERPNE